MLSSPRGWEWTWAADWSALSRYKEFNDRHFTQSFPNILTMNIFVSPPQTWLLDPQLSLVRFSSPSSPSSLLPPLPRRWMLFLTFTRK